jgi:hypothetical protein
MFPLDQTWLQHTDVFNDESWHPGAERCQAAGTDKGVSDAPAGS